MKKYLGSGLVKGIGPVNAGRIVDAFGEATFEVIDADPGRLTEVAGIGPIRASRIAATWTEQRHIREVMAALQGYGISTSLAVRIYKKFGDRSGKVIAEEPYRLAREVWGIGFKTADKIARAVGIAADAPERLQAGVLHALGEAANDGHTLLPEVDLTERAVDLLGADQHLVAEATAALLGTGELVAATPEGEEDRSVVPPRRPRAPREVRYPYASLHALAHAYAISVHKVQGAEFPAVVIPLLTAHAPMLGRTLLYTALTRARRLVVILGQQKALYLAVRDWRRSARRTALGRLLDGTLCFGWSRDGGADEMADAMPDMG